MSVGTSPIGQMKKRCELARAKMLARATKETETAGVGVPLLPRVKRKGMANLLPARCGGVGDPNTVLSR